MFVTRKCNAISNQREKKVADLEHLKKIISIDLNQEKSNEQKDKET